MSDNKKKKQLSKMQVAVLSRTLIPMLMMGIVIVISAFVGYKASIKREVGNSMEAVALTVASAYDQIAPGNYAIVEKKGYVYLKKGDVDVTTNYSIVDAIHGSTDMEVSLVNDNTRIVTTLKNEYGERYVASGINASVRSGAAKSPDFQFYTVDVNGEKYYAGYLPLYNSDETYAGVIEVAKPVNEINKEAMKASLPIIGITIVAMLIVFAIVYSYTGAVVKDMSRIGTFLRGMIGGKLSNDMPREVLARNDEIGKTGKTVVDMQNAIRVLVERDPLTGLYNRRYGNAKLQSVLKYSHKSGMPFAVGLGDIDFFKKVNDTYGHEAGDIVLKKVAEIMKKHMSGKGFVVRWGGEEFLIVFDKQGQADAENELWDILKKVRSMEIIYKELTIRVTMTFGVIDGSANEDYGALIRTADARLYLGKEHGRNQIVACDEDKYVEPDRSGDALAAARTASPAKEEKVETNTKTTTMGIESIKDGDFVEKIIQRMNDSMLDEVEENAQNMYDKMAGN